jgi:transposase-like protein
LEAFLWRSEAIKRDKESGLSLTGSRLHDGAPQPTRFAPHYPAPQYPRHPANSTPTNASFPVCSGLQIRRPRLRRLAAPLLHIQRPAWYACARMISRTSATSQAATRAAPRRSIIKAPERCPHCNSKRLIKKGTRKKKLEDVPLFRCRVCGRTFAPGPRAIRNKTYPLLEILEASLCTIAGTHSRKLHGNFHLGTALMSRPQQFSAVVASDANGMLATLRSFAVIFTIHVAYSFSSLCISSRITRWANATASSSSANTAVPSFSDLLLGS